MGIVIVIAGLVTLFALASSESPPAVESKASAAAKSLRTSLIPIEAFIVSVEEQGLPLGTDMRITEYPKILSSNIVIARQYNLTELEADMEALITRLENLQGVVMD